MGRRGANQAAVVAIIAASALPVACQGDAPASSIASQPPSFSGSAEAAGPPQILELSTKEFAFSTETLHAVAGRAIVIHFVNDERSSAHNFSLWRDESRTDKLFHGELVGGGEEVDYELGSLEAGDYYFECFPHLDTMNGHLIVEDD